MVKSEKETKERKEKQNTRRNQKILVFKTPIVQLKLNRTIFGMSCMRTPILFLKKISVRLGSLNYIWIKNLYHVHKYK
jgi:hypothetical protein